MATYRNSFNGAIVVSLHALGYPFVEVDASSQEPLADTWEMALPTADATLAYVGDDATLAQEALDREYASRPDKPRKSLVTKLQRIIDNAAS